MSEEEQSLDESMAETMAEINDRESTDDSEQTEEISEVSEDTTEETAETEVEEVVAEKPEEEKPEESVAELEEKEEPEEKSVTNAPTAFSAAAKAEWDKTPKAVQDAALKREEDTTRGAQMLKERASYGDRVQNAVAPYMAMIQSKGGNVEQFIQGMGNTYYGLTSGTVQERQQVIQNLARSAGVDLSQIQPQSAQDQQLDPLRTEIQQLRQQVSQQGQQRTQQEDFSINQALTAFESETDESGLKHPYFANVQAEMVAIIPQIRQSNPNLSHTEVLNQAYDNSIWANPETRQLLQVQQDKKADVERKRKAKEIAAKAEKANKVNLGKKGEHPSKQAKPSGTIDEDMAATMKEIKNR